MKLIHKTCSACVMCGGPVDPDDGRCLVCDWGQAPTPAAWRGRGGRPHGTPKDGLMMLLAITALFALLGVGMIAGIVAEVVSLF